MILSILGLAIVILLGSNGRRLAEEGDQLSIFVYFFIGIVLFVFVTILTRKMFFEKIVEHQGLFHPKMVLVMILIFWGYLIQSPSIRIVLLTTSVLAVVDVLIQNQLHDYAFIVSKFSMTGTLTVPVFQIPFQRHIIYNFNNEGGLSLGIRRKGGSTYLHPHEISDSDDGWYEVDYIREDMNSDGKIVIFRTNVLSRLFQLITTLENIVPIKFEQ